MSASSVLVSDTTEHDTSSSYDTGEAMSVADVGAVLGISDAGVLALANAGLLGRDGAEAMFPRTIVDDLTERIWRAALPTSSEAPGMRIRNVVENAALWPSVIAALLHGRVNAFRRRASFSGGVLGLLIVSSERVCKPARGPDADRREKCIISFMGLGSATRVDTHPDGAFTALAAAARRVLAPVRAAPEYLPIAAALAAMIPMEH
jgi:hypothetical protein